VQEHREPRDHGLGLVDDLPPREPDHAVAGRDQVGVAPAVALERVPRAVEREAVDLDDQPLFAPQQVDLPAARLRSESSRAP
jgi:hypothetical protein